MTTSPAPDLATLAANIIDAIPEAMGITPDPWPVDGPHPDHGEPHRAVERILGAALGMHLAALAKLHQAGMPTDTDAAVAWIHQLITKCERCDSLQRTIKALGALPTYQEHDIVKMSPHREFLLLDDVEALLSRDR
jgi:LmbE family N-acetylglucosaminyl deacetylase